MQSVHFQRTHWQLIVSTFKCDLYSLSRSAFVSDGETIQEQRRDDYTVANVACYTQ